MAWCVEGVRHIDGSDLFKARMFTGSFLYLQSHRGSHRVGGNLHNCLGLVVCCSEGLRGVHGLFGDDRETGWSQLGPKDIIPEIP